jgi:outer membrane protein TolC
MPSLTSPRPSRPKCPSTSLARSRPAPRPSPQAAEPQRPRPARPCKTCDSAWSKPTGAPRLRSEWWRSPSGPWPARALGSDPNVAYRPTELPSAPPPLEGDSASWLSRALAARPSLRVADERFKAQTFSVKAEERANWPEIAAWGQIQDDRSSSSAQSGAFGALLRWRLFDPTRGKRVAVARASRDQVRLEVETAWRRAEAARERYAAAAGGAEEGREALRVLHERYQQGMATLTDELETEAASLASELDELRIATEAAIADAALLRAAGGL